MNTLLSIEPAAGIFIILSLVVLVIAILVIVKFFEMATTLRHILWNITDIRNYLQNLHPQSPAEK